MENRQRYFEGRPVFLGVYFRGNATPVIFDGDGVVGVYDHVDGAAVTCQRFVDGIVNHFVHQVVKPPVVHITDIHGRPFPDGLESLQNLYAVGSIGVRAVPVRIDIAVPLNGTVFFQFAHFLRLKLIPGFPMAAGVKIKAPWRFLIPENSW